MDFYNQNIATINIISKPIKYDAQRKFLTSIYRENHTGDCDHRRDGVETCVRIKPRMIVIHMTDINDLKNSFEAMNEPIISENRTDLIKRNYDRINVSAHFLIDKEGTIYQLMPENYMARHAMGVNHLSIGIENVGLNKEEPTKKQIESNIKLIKYLKSKYDIEEIISHSEISDFKNTTYFVEKIDNFFRDKDCGDRIIKEIRSEM